MHRKLVFLVVLLALALSLTAFAGPVSAQEQENGIPWWTWLLIILALLMFAAVLIIWWLGGTAEEEQVTPAAIPTEAEAPSVDVEVAEAADIELPEVEAEAPIEDVELPEVEADAPIEDVELPVEEVRAPAVDLTAPEVVEEVDDLKVIEGIGPKISQVLTEAGIGTFASLAATTPERIDEILAAESSRLASLANPATWPEQAQLAAEGRWDELQALQDSLVGGRVAGPNPT
jgi:predicted flap endonuclease-1-like 5' DNA nuclease